VPDFVVRSPGSEGDVVCASSEREASTGKTRMNITEMCQSFVICFITRDGPSSMIDQAQSCVFAYINKLSSVRHRQFVYCCDGSDGRFRTTYFRILFD
jgi:hypothetical protein